MRTSKYSEEQIIGFLRQDEAGMPIKEIGRKHGFSDASFYKCRAKYGGMDVSEAKRLRELELDNGKLKACWPKRTWTSTPLKACSAQSASPTRAQASAQQTQAAQTVKGQLSGLGEQLRNI